MRKSKRMSNSFWTNSAICSLFTTNQKENHFEVILKQIYCRQIELIRKIYYGNMRAVIQDKFDPTCTFQVESLLTRIINKSSLGFSSIEE